MRPLLFTLMLFMICSHSHGQAEWDKTLHFVGGSLFGLAGAGIAKQASKGNRFWTFAGAVGGSTLIGVAKEAVDAGQRSNGWDNEDLAATILGGITVGLAVELFSKKDAHGRLRGKYSPVVFQWEPSGTTLWGTDFDLDQEGLPALVTLGMSRGLSEIK